MTLGSVSLFLALTNTVVIIMFFFLIFRLLKNDDIKEKFTSNLSSSLTNILEYTLKEFSLVSQMQENLVAKQVVEQRKSIQFELDKIHTDIKDINDSLSKLQKNIDTDLAAHIDEIRKKDGIINRQKNKLQKMRTI